MKVVFDNNIWISYAIGNHLNDISSILLHAEIELFTCNEMFEEFERVRQYPKLQKILKPKRVAETLELINAKATNVTITSQTADFSDPKDNYLLNLCQTVKANYLVTGDKRLLTLEIYESTKIITYRQFCEIIELEL